MGTAKAIADVERSLPAGYRLSWGGEYSEFVEAKQQMMIIADQTQTLQEATRNSRLLYSNGIATYLEVITAQTNVLQSELQLVGIINARLDATVDLYRSVGGGWN